jgi:hypothetical protein
VARQVGDHPVQTERRFDALAGGEVVLERPGGNFARLLEVLFRGEESIKQFAHRESFPDYPRLPPSVEVFPLTLVLVDRGLPVTGIAEVETAATDFLIEPPAGRMK